jgi:cytochrome bd-type quinol oxidase subunit 2
MESLLGLGIFVASTLVLLTVADQFPRNADHSMKLAYYGPILAVLGVGSALLLRRERFRKSPFAMSAWMFVLMALAAIAAGAIDLFLRHSS